MVSQLLEKYIWLVQTLLRAGNRGLTLNDIQYRWESRFGTEYPRRSFNNHREAVQDIFGIEILCNRSENTYYIDGGGEGIDDGDETKAWLINTFTVNNLLTLGKERLKGRVSVEDIPSGRQHLTTIMEAMQDNFILRVGYQKYVSAEGSGYTIHPYAVKEADKRWYLVGYCEERQGVRVYGLDRIKSVEITDRSFRMPSGFDVEELFATAYGVYLPDEGARAESITFRATPKEAKFLRDLPLHHTQKEISESPDGVTFSIFVCPNDKLIMDLLSRAERIEVLSPARVRDALATAANATAGVYGRSNG